MKYSAAAMVAAFIIGVVGGSVLVGRPVNFDGERMSSTEKEVRMEFFSDVGVLSSDESDAFDGSDESPNLLNVDSSTSAGSSTFIRIRFVPADSSAVIRKEFCSIVHRKQTNKTLNLRERKRFLMHPEYTRILNLDKIKM